MGARAQDMSKLLTVEVLEARAEAVQHVSYDQLLKAPVNWPVLNIMLYIYIYIYMYMYIYICMCELDLKQG